MPHVNVRPEGLAVPQYVKKAGLFAHLALIKVMNLENVGLPKYVPIHAVH